MQPSCGLIGTVPEDGILRGRLSIARVSSELFELYRTGRSV